MNERDFKRIAAITEAHHKMCLVMWSSTYPFGHCAVASLTLAPVLRASTEIDLVMCIGHVNGHRHAWLENQDMIIDPTLGQFEFGWSDEPWIVVLKEDLAEMELNYQIYQILDMRSEESARLSILPRSSSDGWSSGSLIKKFFGQMKVEDALQQA